MSNGNLEENKELYKTLVELEKKLLEGSFDVNLELQSHKSDIDRLREVVERLREQDLHVSTEHKKKFDDVGKNLTVTSDKLSELIIKLDNLEDRIIILEEHKSKSDNRVWSYVDKTIIAIISGIMTMLFNNLL